MEETLTYRVSQQVLDVNFILETIKFAIFAKLEFKRILTFFVFFNFFLFAVQNLMGHHDVKEFKQISCLVKVYL